MKYEIFTNAGRWDEANTLHSALMSMDRAAKNGLSPWLVSDRGKEFTDIIGTHATPHYILASEDYRAQVLAANP